MTTINKYFFYNDKQSVVVLLGKVEEMKARLLQLEQENTKVIARLWIVHYWDERVFKKGTGNFEI